MLRLFSDWLIILLYSRSPPRSGYTYTRSSRSTSTSSRAAPSPGRAGTSMVATVSADTPLVVAGLVARYSVAGNWLWWNGAVSGILTVFFFARLWRRAGVLTDLEFAELRYGGKRRRRSAASGPCTSPSRSTSSSWGG